MTIEMNDHDVLDDKHRAACAACTTLWAELEQISADAAKLPSLTPSRDLWPEIADRIAAPVIGAVTPVPTFRRDVACAIAPSTPHTNGL